MKNIPNRLYPLCGLIAVAGGILACRWPTPARSDCERGVADPTDQDVAYTLQFTGDTFESADWQKSYTVGEQRVSATWLNGAESGLDQI